MVKLISNIILLCLSAALHCATLETNNLKVVKIESDYSIVVEGVVGNVNTRICVAPWLTVSPQALPGYVSDNEADSIHDVFHKKLIEHIDGVVLHISKEGLRIIDGRHYADKIIVHMKDGEKKDYSAYLINSGMLVVNRDQTTSSDPSSLALYERYMVQQAQASADQTGYWDHEANAKVMRAASEAYRR